jgi:hypothetical protein
LSASVAADAKLGCRGWGFCNTLFTYSSRNYFLNNRKYHCQNWYFIEAKSFPNTPNHLQVKLKIYYESQGFTSLNITNETID